MWKGPRFVLFWGQSDTHWTHIWHPYSKYLSTHYTLAVGRPDTRTEPLLWDVLIRVTRLVAYLCTYSKLSLYIKPMNFYLLSTVNQSRWRKLRPIYLRDMACWKVIVYRGPLLCFHLSLFTLNESIKDNWLINEASYQKSNKPMR